MAKTCHKFLCASDLCDYLEGGENLHWFQPSNFIHPYGRVHRKNWENSGLIVATENQVAARKPPRASVSAGICWPTETP